MSMSLVVEADGGSRGNPGIAGSGSLIFDAVSGEVLAEIGVFLGVVTNNVAEYRGMVEGVRCALEIDPTATVEVRMDSKLVVEQMSGRWKIKHHDMQALAQEAHEIIGSSVVSFVWIPRAENARADAIANQVMDLRRSFRL
jgi:ribonuclease HI